MLRSTLLKLSESQGFARWVTSNRHTRGMSHRFVAGEELDEAISAARVCNDQGMLVSLDYLGENVANRNGCAAGARCVPGSVRPHRREKLNANRLLQADTTWLDLSPEFCEGHSPFHRRACRFFEKFPARGLWKARLTPSVRLMW
jgi:proline dehydrogenase